ncbi:MAG: transporter [Candidatus Thermoplasmatota archaeon]|nr:transporter [Candidatus Thermoplasmatota archaeon]
MAAYADLAENFTQVAQRHGTLVVIQTIVAIANTTANAFTMIYLLRQGMSYVECALFLLVAFVVALLLATYGSNLVARNFATSMRIGMAAMAAYYIALAALSGWALMVVPPLFLGTYIVMFWVPYNSLISHATSQERRGAGVGAYFLVFPAVSTVGPLAGGLIITLGSYDMLFAFGAAVIGVNILLLSRPSAVKVDPGLTAGGILSPTRRRVFSLAQTDKRVARGLFAQGVQDGVFWMALPVLSFEFATDEVALSGYLSLFAFCGALMTVALGYLSDRVRERGRILRASAALTVVFMIVCGLAASAEGYLTGMSATNFWLAVIAAFLFTLMVDRSEKAITAGMMVREAMLNAGRVVGMSITILLLVLDFDLSISMFVAAGAVATMVAFK